MAMATESEKKIAFGIWSYLGTNVSLSTEHVQPRLSRGNLWNRYTPFQVAGNMVQICSYLLYVPKFISRSWKWCRGGENMGYGSKQELGRFPWQLFLNATNRFS